MQYQPPTPEVAGIMRLNRDQSIRLAHAGTSVSAADQLCISTYVKSRPERRGGDLNSRGANTSGFRGHRLPGLDYLGLCWDRDFI